MGIRRTAIILLTTLRPAAKIWDILAKLAKHNFTKRSVSDNQQVDAHLKGAIQHNQTAAKWQRCSFCKKPKEI